MQQYNISESQKTKKKTKKKTKPVKLKIEINEVLVNSRQKIHNAIKMNDIDLLQCILDDIKKSITENKETNDVKFSWTTEEFIKVSSCLDCYSYTKSYFNTFFIVVSQ